MATEKWSAFPNGGAMVTGDQLVGLRSGANTRLTPVIPAQVQQSAFNFAALGGFSNAFTVTLTPAVTALTDGMIVTFYSGSKFNTIAAPTLSVNGLTPVTIVCWSGGLAPNDITTATEYLCIYNLTDNVFQLTNPSISTANTFEVQANGYNYALDTGVANAYIANILPAQISSILSGFEVIMSAIHANSGASTLTVNGVTYPILLSNGAALSGGEILANGIYQFIYSSALAAFVLMNPSMVIAPSVAQANVTYTGLAINSLAMMFDYISVSVNSESLNNLLIMYPLSFSGVGPNTIDFGNVQALGISYSANSFTPSWANTTSISFLSLIYCQLSFSLTMPLLTTLNLPVVRYFMNGFSFNGNSLVTISMPSVLYIAGSVTITGTSLTSFTAPSMIFQGSVGTLITGTANALTTLTLTSLTIMGGWTLTANALTTLNLPALTAINGAFTPVGTLLSTISMPLLTVITGAFSPTLAALTSLTLTSLTTVTAAIGASFGALTSFSLPALVSCAGITGSFNSATTFSLPNLTTISGAFTPQLQSLVTLSLPALTSLTGAFTIGALNAMTTISMPALITIGGVLSSSMPAVTTITLTNLTTLTGGCTMTAPVLTTLSMPALTTLGASWIPTLAALTTLSLPSLTTVGGSGQQFSITLPAATTVNLPLLASVSSQLSGGGANISTLTLTSLATLGTNINLANMNSLVTLNLPALVSVGGLVSIGNGTVLANFSFGATLKSIAGNVTITAAALTKASVDGILVSLAALDGTNGTTAYSNKTVNLSGGTSATPSATGLAAKAVLVARGCTVTTN